jgi:formate dehydrogenase iron-sulfur subunit
MGDVYREGAILQDEKTGAVLYTDKTKAFSAEEFKEIREACPYDIPRRNEATGLLTKCTMCNDRVHSGLLPACVKVCPTGTMQFGERADMLKLAEKRLALLKRKWPKAQLADPEDVNVIYLLIDDPEYYHTHSVAQSSIGPMTKKQFLATLARPFKAMAKA